MTVDWSKPIEAFHADGMVVPMVATGEKDQVWRLTYESPRSDTNVYWEEDGRDPCSRSGWRIRNVATPTTDDTVAVKRMTQEQIEEIAHRHANKVCEFWPAANSNAYKTAVAALQEAVGISDPTPLEGFLAEHPTADPDTAEKAIKWMSEQ